MEKIQNMYFDVVFLSKNIRTCLFTHVFLNFLHLVLTFTPPLHHNGKGSIFSGSCRIADSTKIIPT